MKLSVRIALLLILFFSADLCFSYVQKELRPQTALQDRAIPSALHPLVKQNAELLRTAALKKGITVVITEGFRSIEEQNELYRQGRSKKGNIVTYAKRQGILPQLRPCDRLRPAKKGWKPDVGYDARRKPKRHARLA